MRSEEEIELKYAPRKCEYFCMGDCCLPDTNRSCGTDKDDCEYYNLYAQLLQLKTENDKLTQKLEKAREALENIKARNYCHHLGSYLESNCNNCLIGEKEDCNKFIAQQALKELE